jgi:serine O-acetyltransferase
MKTLLGALRLLTLLPAYLVYLRSDHTIIDGDIDRWQVLVDCKKTRHRAFFYLMRYYPEFRSLLYYRMSRIRLFRVMIGPPMPAVYINTSSIGPGLFLQHAFATIIDAKSIGKNCWINQQVTVGYTDATGHPTIGDNVFIFAGAKILGDITIGDGAVIGAGAVVTKSVPAGCVVVGNPAYIVRRNGVKCREPL